MSEDIPSFFKDLGFSENETKVYLALLDLGQTTIGPISTKSNVQPTKAYVALDKLIARGLLSFVHMSNVKYFQTNDPEHVMKIVREQEEKAKSILPLLKQKKIPIIENGAEVYDGKESIRALYDSIIKKMGPDDFYYGFALKREYILADPVQLFFRKKHQLLNEKGVDDRLIVHESVKKDFKEVFGDIPGIKYCFVKANLPLGLSIIKDRVINTVWNGRPSAFEIHSASLAEQYKKFFLDIWGNHCEV